MTWAWEQLVKPGPKLVLIALADHSDGAGVCWPGHELIAAKCGLSRQTVLEHISTLAEEGYLIAEAGRDSRGRVVKSRYFLQLTRSEPGKPITGEPCRETQHGAMSGNPTRSHVGNFNESMSGFPVPIKEEPKAIEPKTQANPGLFVLGKDAIEAWFDAKFWPRYPKKVGRAKALKALSAAAPDPALLNEIEEGLSHRLAAEEAARVKGEWFRSWPDAHRWLRLDEGRWRDRFDVPRETKRDDRGCWSCGTPAVAVTNGRAHCRKHNPIFHSEGATQ